MSKRFRTAVVASALVGAIPEGVLASEGEWRWRIYEFENKLDMYVLDSDDAATDALGSLRFHCERGSGRIAVESIIGPVERKAFADLISRNEEPHVRRAVPGQDIRIGLAQPSYSELDGWMYSYDMAADERAFDDFRQTGTFRIKLGSRIVETTQKAGLDTVAKFQAACKKR